jgi:hypothetical protein
MRAARRDNRHGPAIDFRRKLGGVFDRFSFRHPGHGHVSRHGMIAVPIL